MSKMIRAMCVSICMLASSPLLAAEAKLPIGAHPDALSFPHFPNRVHAFVWRNWSLVEAKRLAEVLDTPVENVIAIATSMGLSYVFNGPVNTETPIRLRTLTPTERYWRADSKLTNDTVSDRLDKPPHCRLVRHE